MNWIKTSERLPIVGEEVLICASRLIHDVGFLEEDNSWRDIYGDLLYATIESVEYWMEIPLLPPLPEEQGKMRIEPTQENKAFQTALTAVIGNEGKDLDSAVILAVTANLVGRLIAMQDQRKYSTQQIMKMVGENIEQGNKEVIDGLLNETTGGVQ